MFKTMTRKFNLSESQPLYQYDEDNATQLGGLLIYYSLNKYILNPYYVPDILLNASRESEKKKFFLTFQRARWV